MTDLISKDDPEKISALTEISLGQSQSRK